MPRAAKPKPKARIARFEELSDYEYQKRNETPEIFIPVAERLGSKVIEFKNVSKAFGDRLLIDNLSMNVPAGAIVGIIGPNGAGKSTLFKLIAGKEQPDSGHGGNRSNRARWPMWTSHAISPRTIKPCGTPSQTAPGYDNRGQVHKWLRAPMRAALTSTARTSKRRWACSPVVSAVACTWPRP